MRHSASMSQPADVVYVLPDRTLSAMVTMCIDVAEEFHFITLAL